MVCLPEASPYFINLKCLQLYLHPGFLALVHSTLAAGKSRNVGRSQQDTGECTPVFTLPSPGNNSQRPLLPLYLAPKPGSRKAPNTALLLARDSGPSCGLRAWERFLSTTFQGLFPERPE